MKNFNTNTNNNDEWLTPPYIIKALGEFNLDPCSPVNRPWDTAKKHYNINDNGLIQPWQSRIWLNPPYGRDTFTWMNKLGDHGNGIALTFARTETIGFHREIWDRADAIFFFKGRLKFFTVDGKEGDSANAPSCLVAYGRDNVASLKLAWMNGKIIGKYIEL